MDEPGAAGATCPWALPGPLLWAGWMGAVVGPGASCPAWGPYCCSGGLEEEGGPASLAPIARSTAPSGQLHPSLVGGMLSCSGRGRPRGQGY